MKINYQSPVLGQHLDISYAPDPVFSEKMVGVGFVVLPIDQNLFSPIDGIIKLIMPTRHAIAIAHPSGIDLLIHIGFDSGWSGLESIDLKIKQGDVVKQGDLLAILDLTKLNEHAKSTAISIVFVQKHHLEILNEIKNHGIIELEIEVS